MSGIDVNTLLCLHCDGLNGGTTFTDASQYSRTITVTGGANTDTSQFEFGTASCRVGTGANDWIGDTGLNYSLGTGNFTVDLWLRFNSVAVQSAIFTDSNNSEATIDVEFIVASGIRVQYNAGSTHTFTWAPSTGTWYHFALVRSSNTTTVYINGTALSGAFTATDNLAACGLQFGQRATGATQLNGWMDEIRVSNVARWTSNFTPPTAAYTQVPISGMAWFEPFDYATPKKARTDPPAMDPRVMPAVGISGVAWTQPLDYATQRKAQTTPCAFAPLGAVLAANVAFGFWAQPVYLRRPRLYAFTDPIGATFGPIWVASPPAEFTGARRPLYRRGTGTYWKGVH